MYQYFVQLQTGWSQDQGPHKWTLVFAPAFLHPAFDADGFYMGAILYPRLQLVKVQPKVVIVS